MPFLILALAKKGARILQTHFNDLSYHLLKLYTRQLFNKLQKEDIEQKIGKKKLFKFLAGQENHQLLFLD